MSEWAGLALAGGRVEAGEWLLFDTGPGSALGLEVAWGLLDAGERARAERLVYAEHREAWVRSRGWLRRVLGERVGAAPGALRFGYEALGRPFLLDFSEMYFNVSHTGERVAILLGSAALTGIDVEGLDHEFDMVELARTCMSAADVAILSGAEDRRVWFTQFWTAREAVMKATGLGMNLAPESIVTWSGDQGPVQAMAPGWGEFSLEYPYRDADVMVCCAAGQGGGLTRGLRP